MNWKVFFTRLGSAIVFCIIMMLGLLGHLYNSPFSIWVLAILIQFLCIKEFFKLMQNIFPDAFFPAYIQWMTQIVGVLLIWGIALFNQDIALIAIAPISLLFAGVLHKKTGLIASLTGITALVYIGLPMAFMVKLWSINPAIPLALILMIWMNDTMAYIVGSFIGKTPFSPISPKKTWEGTAGGAVLTVAGAAVWAHYANIDGIRSIDWMVLAACAAFAGTVGDLLESKLKRLANIKDSGNIMPGHGGALDRFDSLLAALPFAFCYVMLFMIQFS
jgi:phosphatidate cytidylyltransferase